MTKILILIIKMGKGERIVKDVTKTYGEGKIRNIKIVQIVGILIWTLLVYFLQLYMVNWIGYVIIAVPYFLFLLAYWYTDSLNEEVEETNFDMGFLSVGIILILPLLHLVDREFRETASLAEKNKLMNLMLATVVFALFSLVDIWVSRKYISIVRHVKSMFLTIAITLIMFIFYIFYMHRLYGHIY